MGAAERRPHRAQSKVDETDKNRDVAPDLRWSRRLRYHYHQYCAETIGGRVEYQCAEIYRPLFRTEAGYGYVWDGKCKGHAEPRRESNGKAGREKKSVRDFLLGARRKIREVYFLF